MPGFTFVEGRIFVASVVPVSTLCRTLALASHKHLLQGSEFLPLPGAGAKNQNTQYFHGASEPPWNPPRTRYTRAGLLQLTWRVPRSSLGCRQLSNPAALPPMPPFSLPFLQCLSPIYKLTVMTVNDSTASPSQCQTTDMAPRLITLGGSGSSASVPLPCIPPKTRAYHLSR